VVRLHIDFGGQILGHAVQPDERGVADGVENVIALHEGASLLKKLSDSR
jgi:hypothetical protein